MASYHQSMVADLSLAGLGLGFQTGHLAIFGLSAVTADAFWFLDGLMKGYQCRYYVRMRDIEYSAHLINSVQLGASMGPRETLGSPDGHDEGVQGLPLWGQWNALALVSKAPLVAVV
jgi:hypothetical protein